MDTTLTRRWFHLTPDRLIVSLLAVEGFLLLSERFCWFAFNEKKGWTVLTALASIGVVALLMLLWFAAGLLFRWRFQFSMRSLMVMVVAVAVPCSWLAVEMREAQKQRMAVEAVKKGGVEGLLRLPVRRYRIAKCDAHYMGVDANALARPNLRLQLVWRGLCCRCRRSGSDV
jgi:hypothetical protein